MGTNRPRVLFVLQNAWRKGAKPGEKDIGRERAWMRLLWRSQSGRRLREMIPPDIDEQQSFVVVNASPFVGSRSFAVFVADSMLMHSRMRRLRPDVVVLCGKVAQELAYVVEQYETPCVTAPHPAWRLLSKVRTAEIRTEIELALRDSFPVTDDLLDAPDGAVVNGYERVGASWERIRR